MKIQRLAKKDFVDLLGKICIMPQEVKVTFSGARRKFYFFNKDEIKLFLKLLNIREGVSYINVSSSDIFCPRDIKLEKIEPAQVKVTIKVRSDG